MQADFTSPREQAIGAIKGSLGEVLGRALSDLLTAYQSLTFSSPSTIAAASADRRARAAYGSPRTHHGI